jgi:hypothetical protein
MKVFSCIIALLIAAVLFGCPTTRLKHLARPEVFKADGDYTHAASGMTFPPRVGNFKRNNLIHYDTKNLDMSAGYELVTVTGTVAATVYVYPAPSLIFIGSPPHVVAAARDLSAQNEFDARKREVMHFRPGVILIQERKVSLQQGTATYLGRMATFEYEEVFTGQRQLLRSHLYLFCFVGDKWVIKYRFTHPRFFDATKELDEFMKNLSWTLI